MRARFTTFRRIVLPNLVPAISAGTALAFARAISEFGATVLISDNLPFKTQVASVHIFGQIETDNTVGAAAVATVLLLIALVVLLGLDLLQRWAAARHAVNRSKYVMRFIAVGYIAILIGLPVVLIFWRTFEHGLGPVIDALSDPSVLHAFRVTAIVTFWTVILNTIFGVGIAILLVRRGFPGRRLLSVLIDLPLAVSPVVVGLALILVYGRFAPVGGWLDDHGIQVIFAYPGMILATMFVSLPLVVREVAPVLEEIGIEQEQAAGHLGAEQCPDVPTHHTAGHPVGASPTESC